MELPSLPRLPVSARLLITAFLVSMALNHLFAGGLAWQLSHSELGSIKEHFQYKDLIYLLRMSHQHAFGHGIIYALLGAVFLLSSWPEKLKAAIILTPFLGALLDLSSWWMLKYLAGDYEWLSIAGGIISSLGFAIMTLRILYELWFQEKSGKGQPLEER